MYPNTLLTKDNRKTLLCMNVMALVPLCQMAYELNHCGRVHSFNSEMKTMSSTILCIFLQGRQYFQNLSKTQADKKKENRK